MRNRQATLAFHMQSLRNLSWGRQYCYFLIFFLITVLALALLFGVLALLFMLRAPRRGWGCVFCAGTIGVRKDVVFRSKIQLGPS